MGFSSKAGERVVDRVEAVKRSLRRFLVGIAASHACGLTKTHILTFRATVQSATASKEMFDCVDYRVKLNALN
jgi:hypothetical protein